MYSLTLSACTSLAGSTGFIRLAEVARGGKWNLATTPPGLLQSELQGCSCRAILPLVNAFEGRKRSPSRPGGQLPVPLHGLLFFSRLSPVGTFGTFGLRLGVIPIDLVDKVSAR